MSEKKQDKSKQLYDALKILELPQFVSYKEIKTKYYELSKKYHPDIYKDKNKMVEINSAYNLLKEYIENFKYSFDEDEVHKQYPENYHADRFRF